MRIEKSATSISWIPSHSIRGVISLPFAAGIMHYDPPPPLELTDLMGMRERGEFRFANQLSAYIDVEEGKITGYGSCGGLLMGRTPISAGPIRPCSPRKGTGKYARSLSLLRAAPHSCRRSAGGRYFRWSGRLPAGRSSH